MDITIHSTLLPHDDPYASLAFYRINLTTTDLDGTFERLQASAERWSRSRPSSRTGFGTAPSAIPPGT